MRRKKIPKLFFDYFMQNLFEELVKSGKSLKKASVEVKKRFKQYDKG
jgi:hypothetical protein